jgi:hypothetical protein
VILQGVDISDDERFVAPSRTLSRRGRRERDGHAYRESPENVRLVANATARNFFCAPYEQPTHLSHAAEEDGAEAAGREDAAEEDGAEEEDDGAEEEEDDGAEEEEDDGAEDEDGTEEEDGGKEETDSC